MKRYYLIFVFCLIIGVGILFQLGLPTKKTDTVDPVFLETNIANQFKSSIHDFVKKPTDFTKFYLLFDEVSLTNKNFRQLFHFFEQEHYQIEIHEIYPYMFNTPPLPEKYMIGGKTLETSIMMFENAYFQSLTNQNMEEEVSKASIYGIKIKLISIQCSNISMFEFLKANSEIKYSLTEVSGFQKF